MEQRKRLLTLLEQQADLERMARIVGKDALPPAQQLKLLCAELVNEAVLRQSAFSETDRYCSPERQIKIVRLTIRFVDFAEAALSRGVEPAEIAAQQVYRRLMRMSEDIGEDQIHMFGELSADLENQLASLGKAAPTTMVEATHAG